MGGILVALGGPIGVAVVIGAAITCVVAWKPVLAVYIYLVATPFIAGIDRGVLLPLMRPNEGLLVLLITGALVGGYIRVLRGATVRLQFGPLDIPLAAFFVLVVVWPISSMMVRGIVPSFDDLSAVLPMCKLAALYVLVRAAVRTQHQVLCCMRLIIWSAVGLAGIAVLQALDAEPVVTFLESHYHAVAAEAGRATATLSNAIATGDYILIGLALLVTAGVRGLVGQKACVGAGIILAAGIFAVGQFSTLLGALVIAALLLFRHNNLRASAFRLAPILVLALALGGPSMLGRIGDVSEGGFPPQSWRVRWANVTDLYLPDLLADGRFLIGVSPNSFKVPPDTWREVIYLESGYLQFLWIGGIPVLVGFIVLTRAVLRHTAQLGSQADALGACASALAVSWWMAVLLSVFDAHLFIRGSGDVLFTLLGIVSTATVIRGVKDATA